MRLTRVKSKIQLKTRNPGFALFKMITVGLIFVLSLCFPSVAAFSQTAQQQQIQRQKEEQQEREAEQERQRQAQQEREAQQEQQRRAQQEREEQQQRQQQADREREAEQERQRQAQQEREAQQDRQQQAEKERETQQAEQQRRVKLDRQQAGESHNQVHADSPVRAVEPTLPDRGSSRPSAGYPIAPVVVHPVVPASGRVEPTVIVNFAVPPPSRPIVVASPSVVVAAPSPQAIAAANAQADAAAQQLIQAQMYQNYVTSQVQTNQLIQQAADGIRDIIRQTTSDPSLAQAMTDTMGQTDPITDSLMQQMQGLADVGTGRAQAQAEQAGLLPGGSTKSVTPVAGTGRSIPSADIYTYVPSGPPAMNNVYQPVQQAGTYYPYSGTGAQPASPQCAWTEQSLKVTAWGQDTLYLHADVQTSIIDGQGQPSFAGRNIRIVNGTQIGQHFYFGLNGVLDRDLAPGQSVTLPVIAPSVNGNTEQPILVRYCKV